MKLLKLTLVGMLFAAMNLNAQTEVKINPLGLLFGSPDVSAEFRLSNSAGLEPFVGFTSKNWAGGDLKYTAVNAGAAFKYYFNPQRGFDRFYAGAYTRFNNGTVRDVISDSEGGYTRLSLGFMIGQKWVSKKNVVFELGFGVGRAFINNLNDDDGTIADFTFDLDLMGRLAIGYRFGGGKD
ncbi:MAG: DUF3575 domain-containing protein [Saprospiraceae bacterium]|nr:DUF3575 domain-containing protein [Saprospiraceae bacterium]